MNLENVIALLTVRLDRLEEVEASPEDYAVVLELTAAEVSGPRGGALRHGNQAQPVPGLGLKLCPM